MGYETLENNNKKRKRKYLTHFCWTLWDVKLFFFFFLIGPSEIILVSCVASIDHFSQVMRGHIGRHTNGNTRRTIDQ